ncbi:hypothetical protein OKW21_006209 [Catalinimonas alkaloidigena]|nr:hypothetical protein [Catalinimonas alkaloidigena]
MTIKIRAILIIFVILKIFRNNSFTKTFKPIGFLTLGNAKKKQPFRLLERCVYVNTFHSLSFEHVER